ncbi:MAG: hypothetical protein OXN27_18935 [Candidatus Poribacteria bacterium]|nr:hypothetical protein [Candidatus Poribacteria bacterium]
MYRDILTNRWVLGGVGFLILLSIACVLWYQHDIADEKKAAADAEELLRQSEIAKKVANTDSDMEQADDVSSVESETPTAEKPTNRAPGAVTNISTSRQASPVTAKSQETENAEEVRVSPHGFGPYPEIPTQYRDLDGVEDIWGFYEKLAETDPDAARANELGERVLVKLWEQGLRPTGGKHSNGMFYPDYPNTVYVTWEEERLEDGTVERYPTAVGGDSAFAPYEEAFIESDGEIFPSNFTMLNHKKDGIDPYQFLDLP